MAGFLNAFTHLLSGRPWSDLPASFCYTINERVPLPFPSVFALYTGTNNTTAEEVSVFIFDKKTGGTKRTPVSETDPLLCFARNCLKCVRTMRHPYILRIFEAVETPSGIYIATENVKPLYLCEIPPDPSWGIYQIASAVNFINESCNSIHGLICPFTTFVTAQGSQWRLGTFDCVRPITVSPNTSDAHPSTAHPLSSCGFDPPSTVTNSVLVDRWGLALLVTWSYTRSSSAAGNGITAPSLSPPERCLSRIPPLARHLCDDLLPGAAKQRASKLSYKNMKIMLKEHPLFAENPLVKVMLFFEEINLKGNWDKEAFFASLPDVLRTIPCQAQYVQILPQLAAQLEFFARPDLLLPSVLLIGENVRLEASKSGSAPGAPVVSDAAVYQQYLTPVLVKFFKSPDRAARLLLLQHLSSFEAYLSTNDTEDIFDSVSLGFTDSFVSLREATLRSMIYFVPKLASAAHVDKAFQKLSRMLHEDPEGAIRTNAVICLAKLYSSFCKPQHAKAIGVQLIRALKDAFPPCRAAALAAIGVAVCADPLVFSREELMVRFAPAVCHRCVDPDLSVQEAAFTTLQHIIRITKLHSPQPEVLAHGLSSTPTLSQPVDETVTQGVVRMPPPPPQPSAAGMDPEPLNNETPLMQFYASHQRCTEQKSTTPPSGSLALHHQVGPVNCKGSSGFSVSLDDSSPPCSQGTETAPEGFPEGWQEEADQFFDPDEETAVPSSSGRVETHAATTTAVSCSAEVGVQLPTSTAGDSRRLSGSSKLSSVLAFGHHGVSTETRLHPDKMPQPVPSFTTVNRNTSSLKRAEAKAVNGLTLGVSDDLFWTDFDIKEDDTQQSSGVQALKQILEARHRQRGTSKADGKL